MTKKKVSKKEELKKSEPEFQLFGWKCPVCGRGNSPWASTCPCLPVVNVYPTWPPYDPGRPMFPTNPQYDPNLPYYKVTCEKLRNNLLSERLKRELK